jgi:predicted dienelactone hydrolase
MAWRYLTLYRKESSLKTLFTLFLSTLPLLVAAQVGMREAQSEAGRYTLVYPSQDLAQPKRYGPFELTVAPNGTPGRLNGRLVVLSHGSGGNVLSDHQLARSLALAGFVVAQPEHRGDNWQDHADTGPKSWQRRPLEVSQTIDGVGQDPIFAPLLKLDRVGVHGMSAGGVSVMSLAGAVWSPASLTQHCRAQMARDRNFCLFGVRSAQEAQQRIQAFEANVPLSAESAGREAFTSDDKRLAVFSVIVPVGAVFTKESLARITKPVGVISADADALLVPHFHSDYLLRQCATCQDLMRLKGAGHFDTLSPWPQSIATQVAAAQPGGALGKTFDPKDLQIAFDRLAGFFVQNLVTP